jgi:hypothetical protein
VQVDTQVVTTVTVTVTLDETSRVTVRQHSGRYPRTLSAGTAVLEADPTVGEHRLWLDDLRKVRGDGRPYLTPSPFGRVEVSWADVPREVRAVLREQYRTSVEWLEVAPTHPLRVPHLLVSGPWSCTCDRWTYQGGNLADEFAAHQALP